MNESKKAKLKLFVWGAVGFLIGTILSGMIILNNIYVRAEKVPMAPNKSQSIIIKKARFALENVDSLAASYFCSSIQDEGEYYLVNFNDNCGDIKIGTPLIDITLTSPCLNDNYVKVFKNGRIEINK